MPQYSIWSCGPWPRKLYEQVVRRYVTQHGYEQSRKGFYYPERRYTALVLDVGLNKEEQAHWLRVLLTKNIAFQLTTLEGGGLVDNPAREFSIASGTEARSRFGNLKVVP